MAAAVCASARGMLAVRRRLAKAGGIRQGEAAGSGQEAMTPINPYQPPREGAVVSPVSALPVRATGIATAEDALAALTALGKFQVGRIRFWSLFFLALGG